MQHFLPKNIDKTKCSDRIEDDDSITVSCIETARADNRRQDSVRRRDAGTKRLIIDTSLSRFEGNGQWSDFQFPLVVQHADEGALRVYILREWKSHPNRNQ